jgi:YfiH family protein
MHTVKRGALEYLTAENITAPHCFTTRLGGVSEGHLASMNIGVHRGDDPENVRRNYEILAQAIGFSPEKLVLTRQTHSAIVRPVTSSDAAGLRHDAYPESDALITNDPGTALVVFTADCTPILLHDPVTGAVGAVHAGWRGTAAGIAQKTVEAMVATYGTKPENIRAAIGPNIAQCCFETDADVPEAMAETFGPAVWEYIRPIGNKFYVNLKAINALALRRAGVNHIEISTDCTRCNPHKYWSHRFHGPTRGSQGAIILCKEAKV